MMAAGEVDCVITGADRIAANGDTANKIGTYGLAVLAAHHDIPLYVVAPTSTVDLATPTGAEIPIEERSPDEITTRFAARNPAFDVTPAALIAAIVTEEDSPRAVRGITRGDRMKALIIAAGYATRLRPLTDDRAKSLLPVGGRPMIDWIIDKVDEVDDVDEVHLVTNARFADAFSRWAPTRNVVVHDDGTTSNEDRLGAIGDIAFVVDRAGLGARRPARDRGRQPLRLQPRRLRRLLARTGRGRRERDRAVRASAARPAQPVRDRRGRCRRPRQELRREAGEPAVQPRRHRDVHLRPRARCPPARLSRRGQLARTRPAASSSGSTSARRSTATASAASGSTSATTRSCSRRTIGSGPGPGCPSGPSTHSRNRTYEAGAVRPIAKPALEAHDRCMVIRLLAVAAIVSSVSLALLLVSGSF